MSRALDKFEYYLLLGEHRSLDLVAERFRIKRERIESEARSQEWDARAQRIEENIVRNAQDSTTAKDLNGIEEKLRDMLEYGVDTEELERIWKVLKEVKLSLRLLAMDKHGRESLPVLPENVRFEKVLPHGVSPNETEEELPFCPLEYLDELDKSNLGYIRAARHVGMSHRDIEKYRRDFPKFDECVKDIEAAVLEDVEAQEIASARRGDKTVVFHQGVVHEVYKPNQRAREFVLAAKRAEVYGPKGSDETPKSQAELIRDFLRAHEEELSEAERKVGHQVL